MRKIALIQLITALFMMPFVTDAQTVSVQQGNVVIKDAGGKTTELTHSGRDSEPSISPDGRLIVFVREYPEHQGPWGAGTELRLIRADGKGERVLVKDGTKSGPNKYLSSLKFPHFLSDSRRVAFHSGWAAVHGSVHIVDIKTGRIRYVDPEGTLVTFVTYCD